MLLKKGKGPRSSQHKPPPQPSTEGKTEASLVKAAEHLSQGLAILDHSGKILYANRAFSRLLPAPDIQGRNIREIIRKPEFVSALGQRESRNFQLDPSWTGRGHLLARLIHEQDLGILTLEDITQLKKLETIHKDFVANVSHELKTPLTAIAGYAETIIEADSEDKLIAHSAKIILKHTQHLSKLVKDLLTLSSLESQGVRNKRPLILREIVEQALETVSAKAEVKDIVLVSKMETEGRLEGQEDLLIQALVNILDNALKFSPAGSRIEIHLREKGSFFQISVLDQGPGIPPQALERIFERFYQAERDRRRGTGLGLAIVRQIIKAHRGQVWAENRPSGGAAFHIILPRS
ncbi:sensor histidine kinase [Thermosulfuriphilus sp.]